MSEAETKHAGFESQHSAWDVLHAFLMKGGRMRGMKRDDVRQKGAADWSELSSSVGAEILRPTGKRRARGGPAPPSTPFLKTTSTALMFL